MRTAVGSLALLFTALVVTALRPAGSGRARVESDARWAGSAYASRVVELRFRLDLGVPAPEGSIAGGRPRGLSGPVAGRVYPGARVEVEPVDDAYVRVAMPQAWSNSKEERLWLYAEASGFTRSLVEAGTPPPPPPPPPAPPGRRVRDVSARALSLGPGENGSFAHTVCGEVRVMTEAEQGHRERLAQMIDGISIEGWAEDPAIPNVMSCVVTRQAIARDGKYLLRGGATEADEKVVDSIPPNFVTWAPAPRREPPKGIYYWLTQRSDGKGKCHEWKLTEDALIRKAPLSYEGKRAYESFGYQVTDEDVTTRGLLLFGPHYTAKPHDMDPKAENVGGYRCGLWYRYLGISDGAVRVARGVSLDASAWHPDDEERWYQTAAACDAARVKLDAAVAIAAAAAAADKDTIAPGGVHRDCFGTWGEKDEDE